MKLISAFVFATWIVQSLFFLNPKFQASSHLLWQYRPVCVGPGRKPRRPVFSQRGSYGSRVTHLLKQGIFYCFKERTSEPQVDLLSSTSEGFTEVQVSNVFCCLGYLVAMEAVTMVTGQFGFMFTSSRFHIHVYQLCSTLCKKKWVQCL